MRSIDTRIRKLEHRLGCGEHAPPGIRVIVSCARLESALPEDRCIQILEECGHLPRNSGGISLVLLGDIPRGLNAKETETFLREHGHRVCGPKRGRDEPVESPPPTSVRREPHLSTME